MSWQALTRSTIFASTLFLMTVPVFAQDGSATELKEAKLETEIHVVEGEMPRSNSLPAKPNVRRLPRNTVGHAAANHALAKPKTEIKIELLDDMTKPVLTMDVTGGYRMRSPDGFEETPMLQVFSDGRILTGRKSPLVKEVEGQLDLVELKSLLVYVADDCRFFDITSEMVTSDLTAKRVGQIMDAPTMKFTVDLKEHSNAVDVYALPNVAGEFADVPSVASMVAIASRCRHIISMTRLGSVEEASVALTSVNRSLAEKAPDAPQFTMENLQYAEQFVDERRSATFTQEFSDAGKSMMAYATFQVDAKGDESVNLNVIPQRGQ